MSKEKPSLVNLQNWLFEEQRKKYKWWNQNLFRKNKSKYEEESLLKVYGKLQMIDETLKFLGIKRKDRQPKEELK